ncbi:hypothetical protein AB833_15235 [Chromatiales bacterium (ex Bugula neritina AB1)]|nr:hypothetical protein AB833_15235 [Chromatiales bacterium (ex Bugula neritina AB1)]
MNGFKNLLVKLGMRQDIMLALTLVAVIFMMVLPLPTILVDVLIAVNLTFAIILLMVAIYLRNPVNLTTLPAVLLISTLFRLALSITTTRLILLDADAGAIIETFGNFVIAGNIVVGLVVFLIITVVQFVVITKGSERIAEVSARFSLDGMPGKQMSIDSDLRSGGIDLDEARRRRTNLEKESSLYGAMDGAMKFVKGDAIAGLVIIFVNIIGGISIGTMQNDLSMGEALEIYSILTIGDGLIAQIPALFMSIAAGTIVTRVATDESQDLGSDIGRQIIAEPRALQIATIALLGFAFIPGFPTLTFFSLALIVGCGALYMFFKQKKLVESEIESRYWDSSQPGDDDDAAFALLSSVPVKLLLAANLRDNVLPGDLNKKLNRVRTELAQSLGLPFPKFSMQISDRLPADGYEMQIDEIPVNEATGVLDRNLVLALADQQTLIQLGLDAQAAVGNAASWVPVTAIASLQDERISYHQGMDILIYLVSSSLRRHADNFIGVQETHKLLTDYEREYPDLVAEVRQSVPVMRQTEILKRLVSEDISIKNFRIVLETLAEWGNREKDPIMLTEYVRAGLKRQISHHYLNESNTLPAYLLTQDTEDTIRNSIRQTASGSFVALDTAILNTMIDEVRSKNSDAKSNGLSAVLLSSVDVRRHMRTLLENEGFDIPVLSNQDLTNDTRIQSLGYISFGDNTVQPAA